MEESKRPSDRSMRSLRRRFSLSMVEDTSSASALAASASPSASISSLACLAARRRLSEVWSSASATRELPRSWPLRRRSLVRLAAFLAREAARRAAFLARNACLRAAALSLRETRRAVLAELSTFLLRRSQTSFFSALAATFLTVLATSEAPLSAACSTDAAASRTVSLALSISVDLSLSSAASAASSSCFLAASRTRSRLRSRLLRVSLTSLSSLSCASSRAVTRLITASVSASCRFSRFASSSRLILASMASFDRRWPRSSRSLASTTLALISRIFLSSDLDLPAAFSMFFSIRLIWRRSALSASSRRSFFSILSVSLRMVSLESASLVTVSPSCDHSSFSSAAEAWSRCCLRSFLNRRASVASSSLSLRVFSIFLSSSRASFCRPENSLRSSIRRTSFLSFLVSLISLSVARREAARSALSFSSSLTSSSLATTPSAARRLDRLSALSSLSIRPSPRRAARRSLSEVCCAFLATRRSDFRAVSRTALPSLRTTFSALASSLETVSVVSAAVSRVAFFTPAASLRAAWRAFSPPLRVWSRVR
mmetsp:Transcript_34651/g.79021  ORF Transcript_34651/g.79021 Transcript_34651/m.79021 type:complete len:544 (+) Transcript_34651:213-1844(+)